ncbi:MAG TPA: hypothetical protein VF607_00365, partial [Verrucomicrobiae bacterium]
MNPDLTMKHTCFDPGLPPGVNHFWWLAKNAVKWLLVLWTLMSLFGCQRPVAVIDDQAAKIEGSQISFPTNAPQLTR